MFGDVIREMRKSRGHTQVWVAKKLGLNPTQLTRLENNTYEPNIATIRKFAKFFGTSADSLLEIEPGVRTNVSIDELKIVEKLRHLSEEDIKDVGHYIDFRIFMAERRKTTDNEAQQMKTPKSEKS